MTKTANTDGGNPRSLRTMLVCSLAVAAGTSLAIAASVASDPHYSSPSSPTHETADFSEVNRERQLSIDIYDSNAYPLDNEMIEYMRVVGDSYGLDRDSATQREVDEAAERMRSRRLAVVEYHEPDDTIQTDGMSYDELCRSLEQGKRYHIEGFITYITGRMNSDRHVTIRWHGSDSKYECCQILIPHASYKTDVYPQNARWFVGSGTFDGYDGAKPHFTCTSRFDFIE